MLVCYKDLKKSSQFWGHFMVPCLGFALMDGY